MDNPRKWYAAIDLTDVTEGGGRWGFARRDVESLDYAPIQMRHVCGASAITKSVTEDKMVAR